MVRRLSELPTRSERDWNEDSTREETPTREDWEAWYRSLERKIA